MKKNVAVALASSLIISCLIILGWNKFTPHHSDSPEYLVSEFITTPGRQQRALDRVAHFSDQQLTLFVPYLGDTRPLATRDVKFLDTSPKAFEKYYMTDARTVSEVLTRYICWRTARCNPIFPMDEIEQVRHQATAILQTPEG